MENATKLAPEQSLALDRIRAHWLSRLAHDFRGPLFAARGYAKLLRDTGDVEWNESQLRYLDNISDGLNRIASLVTTIPDFPSHENLTLDVVDLQQVIEAAIDSARRKNPSCRIDADLKTAGAATVIDRAKFVAAVQGLLGAAVDFAGQDADVRVMTRRDEQEFTARFSAARRESSQVSPADTSNWCDILRLHGGTANVDSGHEGIFHVTIRLPLVSPSLLREEGK